VSLAEKTCCSSDQGKKHISDASFPTEFRDGTHVSLTRQSMSSPNIVNSETDFLKPRRSCPKTCQNIFSKIPVAQRGVEKRGEDMHTVSTDEKEHP
jgi:hypothetical protein